MAMKKYLLFIALFSSSILDYTEAATTATASISYTVGSFSAITVSGNPGTLTINTATAGSQPTAATDSTTSYAVWTNYAQKIYGSLASNMPSGVTLTANLVATTGGTSAGAVTLSTTSATLVSGVNNSYQSGLGITYTLSATPSAAQVTGSTNTVTFTIST